MSKLKWDQTGERRYQTGISKGVLYLMDANGAYPNGEAWNGLTKVDENPDGAEEQVLWADNIKYAAFRTPENHKGNISAYTHPDGWYACDGQKSAPDMDGMTFGQQSRAPFGLCYRTEIGNDTALEADDGYILHIVYNATVSPSSKSHNTKNENPDAEEMSWDYSSTPVPVENIAGIEQTSTIELNSLKLGDTKMTAIENVLYGTDASGGNEGTAPRLPLPYEIYDIMSKA